jgi:hypothetical protein
MRIYGHPKFGRGYTAAGLPCSARRWEVVARRWCGSGCGTGSRGCRRVSPGGGGNGWGGGCGYGGGIGWRMSVPRAGPGVRPLQRRSRWREWAAATVEIGARRREG